MGQQRRFEGPRPAERHLVYERSAHERQAAREGRPRVEEHHAHNEREHH
jgi:hypothetical protein